MRPLTPALAALACACAACVLPTRVEDVVARDGTDLATNVYLPPGEGPFPVLLVRTPYGKGAVAQGFGDLRGEGIALVTQDLRGRGASGGVFDVFLDDGDGDNRDGVDTFAWIADQDWAAGPVMTTGASANGIVQYVQASARPEGLRGMAVTVATPSFPDHAAFPGGAYREELVDGWLDAIGEPDAIDRVKSLAHDPAAWDAVMLSDRYDVVDVPGMHVGGWHDIFAQGTVDAFVGLQGGAEGARGRQKLIMGPWAHGVGATNVGETTFPGRAEDAPNGIDQVERALVGEALGVDLGAGVAFDDVPAVQYYTMGGSDPGDPGNEWRTAEAWPVPSVPVPHHLGAGGLLTSACPAPGTSSWVADPDDPSPTVCGANLGIASGPCDQAEVEERGDVVSFSTAPLDGPLEITGRLRARLAVSLDQPDADLVVRLTDVHPDGRSMLIVDGVARVAMGTGALEPVAPGEVVAVDVDLHSTSIVLAAGHRLRAVLGSSNHPRYAVNRNNGLPRAEQAGGPSNVATVTLHHGPDSWIELPLPVGSPPPPDCR